MFSIDLGLLLTTLPPRVEDPLPESIGLDLLFTVAAAIGALNAVLYENASEDRRRRAIRRGGVIGFYVGSLAYLVSLLAQVGFGS